MPDNVQAPSANAAPGTSSSTPPGTTDTSATASPPNLVEKWRAGDDAPAWARGKSSEEILGIAKSLVDTFQRTGNAPAASAAAAPAAPAPINYADDDYITGAQLRNILSDAATRSVQPAISQSVDLAASANLGLMRQQYAKDFQRYGPEITQRLATVPKTMWTLDNLETVVKLVRSDHLDELARERASELASSVEPTIRSSGLNASVPVSQNKEHSLESERIPVEWKQRAAAAGVTERVVEEFCRANDMTPEAFYAQFDKPMSRIVEDTPRRREA